MVSGMNYAGLLIRKNEISESEQQLLKLTKEFNMNDATVLLIEVYIAQVS